MKIRPAGSTKGIKHIVGGIIVFWVIFALIVAAALAITTGISEHNSKTYQKYCTITEIANENLNVDQRKELIDTVDVIEEEDLGEDGYFVEHEKPTTIADLSILAQAIFLAIFFCMLSWLASVIYFADCRKNNYFLADLPSSGYSVFLVIVCFMIWPCFVVSRVSFLKFKKKEEKTRENSLELPGILPLFNEEDFVVFYHEVIDYHGRIKHAERELGKSQEKVEILSEELENTTKALKIAQEKVSLDLANLNNLRNQAQKEQMSSIDEAQIAHDFSEIKAMRGVKQVFVNEDGLLIITVRAVHEIGKQAYFIGDFEIVIEESGFAIHRIRSKNGNEVIIRENFCIGDNMYTVRDYLDERRLVEAVEIMIECIHHIEEKDLDEMSKYYKIIKN